LESVGYILISLRKGRLPWQSLKARKGEKKDPLATTKMETTTESLCQGMPTEFLQYMQKVKQLTFDQRPPYGSLRGYFISLMVRNNWAYDYQYDWVVQREKRIYDSLTGATDPASVVVKTSPDEIAAARRARAGAAHNSFHQPLPFFSMVNEAAAFVGMSRRTIRAEEKSTKTVYLRTPDEQTMFVLNPKQTHISAKPFSEDFATME
jgi:hypothetical protein